jgi:hypothetical protein
LGRADSDRNTVDEATGDEHANVLRCARDNGSNTPDGRANLNSVLAAEHISQVSGEEGAEKRPARHGGCDTALHIGVRARALRVIVEAGTMRTLVEVAAVLLGWKTLQLLVFQFQVCNKAVSNDRTYMALIELISNPNNPPPITAIAVIP